MGPGRPLGGPGPSQGGWWPRSRWARGRPRSRRGVSAAFRALLRAGPQARYAESGGRGGGKRTPARARAREQATAGRAPPRAGLRLPFSLPPPRAGPGARYAGFWGAGAAGRGRPGGGGGGGGGGPVPSPRARCEGWGGPSAAVSGRGGRPGALAEGPGKGGGAAPRRARCPGAAPAPPSFPSPGGGVDRLSPAGLGRLASSRRRARPAVPGQALSAGGRGLDLVRRLSPGPAQPAEFR